MTTATTPVTRMEIADHVSATFEHGPSSRDQLLEAASDSGARPELVAVLERLPDRRFAALRQLWQDLHDVPVDL
ncbi:MAG: DUF2795 domain-containing protein [Streptosporangiaceae bacterium]